MDKYMDLMTALIAAEKCLSEQARRVFVLERTVSLFPEHSVACSNGKHKLEEGRTELAKLVSRYDKVYEETTHFYIGEKITPYHLNYPSDGLGVVEKTLEKFLLSYISLHN